MNTPTPFIYCWICAAERPREAFTKRGRAERLCRNCIAMPEQESRAAEQGFEMWEMSLQKNISAKNIARLRLLRGSRDFEVAQLADLMLRLALFHPRKKRRVNHLMVQAPWLLFELEKAGLVDFEYADAGLHEEYDEWLGM
ncbi:MAG: hypothetical protein RL095_3675 [Verrucomicrobiota bacterium]|jgi:hypothetical protein